MKFSRIAIPHPQGGEFSTVQIGQHQAHLPLMIFSHATGFHASTYLPLFESLAPHYRIVAPDARGHGFTTVEANPQQLRSWQRYYDDLSFMLAQFNEPVVLAGHSIGGMCSLVAARRHAERVRGVFAIDPVLLDPLQGSVMRTLQVLGKNDGFSLAAGAKRRRAEFADIAQAFESYRGKRSFSAWPDLWLQHYTHEAFKPSNNVDNPCGVTLRCRPDWESRTFSVVEPWPWSKLANQDCPVKLLLAQRGSTCSANSQALLKRLKPRWSQTVIPDCTHFLPMEKTELVASHMLDF
jgi:pimeloyl-ACP methyl ester carboxylesterase